MCFTYPPKAILSVFTFIHVEGYLKLFQYRYPECAHCQRVQPFSNLERHCLFIPFKLMQELMDHFARFYLKASSHSSWWPRYKWKGYPSDPSQQKYALKICRAEELRFRVPTIARIKSAGDGWVEPSTYILVRLCNRISLTSLNVHSYFKTNVQNCSHWQLQTTPLHFASSSISIVKTRLQNHISLHREMVGACNYTEGLKRVRCASALKSKVELTLRHH